MSYRVVYEFDPFDVTGLDSPATKRESRAALKDIAEYVRDEILQFVGDSTSPVAGYGKFKSLSKNYKEFKKGVSGSSEANMELYGDMLDSLEYKITGDKIQIGWFSGDQAAKADGHNNFSGESDLPLRRSIPGKGETFKKSIVKGMKEIAKDFLPED